MAGKGKAGTHEVAPVVRGAFLRALKIIEHDKGQSFSDLMLAEIEAHGLLAVMDRVSKFQERITTTNLHHSGEVGLVGILESLAAGAGHDTSVESESDSVRH